MIHRVEKSVKKSILKISPYVPGKPVQEVKRELKLKDVVKLASNENPLGPSKKAVAAMKKTAGKVNYYPESSVYYLRKALAKKFSVREDMLMFGNGSNELEQLLAEAFVKPGEEVMFSELTFVVYPIVTNIAGGRAVVIKQKNFRHDVGGFIKKLGPKTKLVFLCNPNNPTGTTITKKEFEKFMRAVNPGTLVVLDEAYFEYAKKGREALNGLKYLEKYKNLVVLRTFSKIYGLAGLRIGYGIADPRVTGIIERVRPPFNVNSMAQAGAEAALSDREHVRKTLNANAEGKKYLYREFKKLGIDYVPTEANFIFVKFGMESKKVFQKLLKKGVIIRPNKGKRARITIGTMSENKKLVKELEKIN